MKPFDSFDFLWKAIFILPIYIVLLFLVGCTPENPRVADPGGSEITNGLLEGKVVNQTQEPVLNARVLIFDPDYSAEDAGLLPNINGNLAKMLSNLSPANAIDSGFTDVDGRFSFLVASGLYNVWILDSANQRGRFFPLVGFDTLLDPIELEAYGFIQGVFDPGSSVPKDSLKKDSILVFITGGPFYALTDSNGKFELPPLPPGNFDLEFFRLDSIIVVAEKTQFFSAGTMFTLPPNDTVNFDSGTVHQELIGVSQSVSDYKGPSIELISHQNGDTVTTAPLAVQVRVIDTRGVDSVKINGLPMAGKAGSLYTALVPITSDSVEFKVIAWDKSVPPNQTQLVFSVFYQGPLLDSISPSITWIYPKDGDTVGTDTLTIIVNITDTSGVYPAALNGQPMAFTNPNFNLNFTLAPGDNTLTVFAQDSSSNLNNDTASISIVYVPTLLDRQAPSLSLSSHALNDTVSIANVPLQITATDNNGIAAVIVNGDTAMPSGGDLFQRTVTLNLGDNPIQIIAVDRSVNANADTLNAIFYYDPTANDFSKPLIQLTSHNSGDTLSTASQAFILTATDINGIGTFTINGETIVGDTSGIYAKSYLLNSGDNNFEVIATDNSLNKNSVTLTFSLVLDVSPPATNVVSHQSGDTVTSSGQTIQIQAGDPSGIFRVTIADSNAIFNSPNFEWTVTLSPDTNRIPYTAEDKRNPANLFMDTLILIYDAPPPPVTLFVPSDSSIFLTNAFLTWSQSTISDFGSYQIFYDTDTSVTTASRAGKLVSNQITVNSVLDSLSSGQPYWVKVFVFDGRGSSTGSNTINFTTK